jgi:hypothetical protein
VNKIQGPIATVLEVIRQVGPAHERDIERHPRVVEACRSSKTKARRHIGRLVAMGHALTDGAAQLPKISINPNPPRT